MSPSDQDLHDMQGRTPEHQARNEQAMEWIVDAMIVLICVASGCYLVVLAFGGWQ